MSQVDYDIFDADNHYYEATDAFTRHLEPGMAKRTMQWAQVEGRTRLMVAGKGEGWVKEGRASCSTQHK